MEITFTGCIDNVYDDVSISFNACGTEDIKFFTVSDTIDINIEHSRHLQKWEILR